VAGLLLLPSVGPAQHLHPPEASPQVSADVLFMQGMIGHHAQALVMTDLLRTRTRNPRMLALGERITVSQQDEIASMERWLRERQLPVPDRGAHALHSAGAHAMMPGMLSPAQLDTLSASRGPAFDRLFLRYMIQHHEGALTMVATLFGTEGAAHDSQLNGFATDVEADQRAEIGRMRAMLVSRQATRQRAR
jgi:uncharacterized protein (DUF305 family)